MPSVFISSTFADLEHHRQVTLDAVAKLECNSHAMEAFGSLPGAPKDECLRLVRSANIFVGIFAMRYGSVDSASGKSLTQLEYEEAQTMRLPSLLYLIDEDRHPVLPRHVDTGVLAEKLVELKATIKHSHVVSFFRSADDLASKVTQDLERLVGAMAIRPTAEVLAQIATNAVRKHSLTPARFAYLKQQMTGSFKCAVPDAILREALELAIAGDNMAAAFVLSRGTPMDLDDAVDGLMAFDKVVAEMVERNRAKTNV